MQGSIRCKRTAVHTRRQSTRSAVRVAAPCAGSEAAQEASTCESQRTRENYRSSPGMYRGAKRENERSERGARERKRGAKEERKGEREKRKREREKERSERGAKERKRGAKEERKGEREERKRSEREIEISTCRVCPQVLFQEEKEERKREVPIERDKYLPSQSAPRHVPGSER